MNYFMSTLRISKGPDGLFVNKTILLQRKTNPKD